MKKWLIHILVLSCKKASFLIEKQSLASLSWLQKRQLRWHLNICEGCKRYNQQTLLINTWLKQNREVPHNLRLSEEMKNKMKVKLGV